MEKKNNVIISDEILMNKIYTIRDQKVMLDRDLAGLYALTRNTSSLGLLKNTGFKIDSLTEKHGAHVIH